MPWSGLLVYVKDSVVPVRNDNAATLELPSRDGNRNFKSPASVSLVAIFKLSVTALLPEIKVSALGQLDYTKRRSPKRGRYKW
jgi:hypothetical protein